MVKVTLLIDKKTWVDNQLIGHLLNRIGVIKEYIPNILMQVKAKQECLMNQILILLHH
jgi:hypothetical protein